MSASTTRGYVTAAAALLLLAGGLDAQDHGAESQRRNQCRIAAGVIESGHPAPRLDWAWQHIGTCDAEQQVATYLAAMRQARQSEDTATVKRVLSRAVFLRDGRLFAETMKIAGDRSASAPARVMAFVALAQIRDPRSAPTYERFVGGLDSRGIPRGGCGRRTAHAVATRPGPVSLPADYLERIAALRASVRTDESEPDDVRSAAACT